MECVASDPCSLTGSLKHRNTNSSTAPAAEHSSGQQQPGQRGGRLGESEVLAIQRLLYSERENSSSETA